MAAEFNMKAKVMYYIAVCSIHCNRPDTGPKCPAIAVHAIHPPGFWSSFFLSGNGGQPTKKVGRRKKMQ
jgi:hypothetical protein